MPVESSAQIHPTARIAANVQIGAFTIVGEHATIEAGARIGNHVVIHPGTAIGEGVRIDDHAVLGKQPMRAARSATTTDKELSALVVGARSLIGAGAILYAGARIAEEVLVADLATIRERVEVGAGTIVGRGVAIENECVIGARCKLETNAYICAFSTLDDDVFVAPGVLTSNDNYMGRTEARKDHYGGPKIRRGARLGVGSVVLPGREIASEAVIAAGAVLTKDAEAGLVHQGVPAQPTRPVSPEQLLSSHLKDDD